MPRRVALGYLACDDVRAMFTRTKGSTNMRVSRKGMKRGVKQTRTVLPPSRKGANARGICAHKSTRYANRRKQELGQIQTGYKPSSKFLDYEDMTWEEILAS